MTVITDCYTCGCNIARKGEDIPEKCPEHGEPWRTAAVFQTIEFVRSPDFVPSRSVVISTEIAQ